MIKLIRGWFYSYFGTRYEIIQVECDDCETQVKIENLRTRDIVKITTLAHGALNHDPKCSKENVTLFVKSS